MANIRQSTAPMRQVLISSATHHDRPDIPVYRLEVLRHGHKGARRTWYITGDGAAICKQMFEATSHSAKLLIRGVLLDWLEDHPEFVKGWKDMGWPTRPYPSSVDTGRVTARDVYDAIQAVRKFGWSTDMPDTRKVVVTDMPDTRKVVVVGG